MVRRARWREWTWSVNALEVGLGRVIAGMTKTKLKPLPTYDELSAAQNADAEIASVAEKRQKSWKDRFERVNRIGRFTSSLLDLDDADTDGDDPI